MNRRGFLQLLGAAGAVAATGLTLEELLAPEKTIFLPSPAIVTPELVEIPAVTEYGSIFIPQLWSNEIMQVYKRNLVTADLVAKQIDRDVFRSFLPRGNYIKFDQIAASYAS